MTYKKNSDTPRGAGKSSSGPTTGKLSRREFAKTSFVAGAAAVTVPNVLRADPQSADDALPVAKSSDKNVAHSQEWRDGLTIPAEYYLDLEHYKEDERYIGENFWLLADHVNRIPETGDFFVFKFGLGESVIVVRGEDQEIRAFNNVCRHRGSRLCKHDEDPRPNDERLSVKQLGESGNAQFFRCPYHAWLYDLDGSLMDAYDVHDDFDMADNGLVPCHTRVEEGQIFLNFSRAAEPPPFERLTKGGDFGEFAKKYGIANLKIAARRSYPIKGNWKLAIENFLECYHCGAAHKTLVTTHDFDYTLTQSQKKRRQSQISAWLGQETVEGSGQLNPGFESGSLDGKQLAPLLPNLKEPTRVTDRVDTYWSTGYWRSYDDYVAMARFTPRGPESTDAEIIWLVHPDAVEGKDYDPEKLMALWDITMREDAWLVENNHVGVKSGGYRAGHYSAREGWPSGFIDWYMNEVVKA